jgi:hypothetical protein
MPTSITIIRQLRHSDVPVVSTGLTGDAMSVTMPSEYEARRALAVLRGMVEEDAITAPTPRTLCVQLAPDVG